MTTVVPGSPTADWTDANQRYLVAEFARLKARVAGDDTAAAEREVEEARAAMPSPAAIDQLAGAFELTPFERDVLLLCAGVEMDSRLADSCAAASDTRGRPLVTFGLALARLQDPHWTALIPVRPLRLSRLLDVKDERALTSSQLSIDERVLHYLAGVNYLDLRLGALVRRHAVPTAMADSHAAVVDAILHDLEARDGSTPVVQITGTDSLAQRDVAAIVAHRLDLRLYALRDIDIPANVHEADAFSLLWNREAVLFGAALLIACSDGGEHAATRLVERLDGLVFVAGREAMTFDRPELRLTVDIPSASEQKHLWVEALGPAVARLNGALDGIGAQFRLSAASIARTGERLRASIASATAPGALLWRECRTAARRRLNDLALRVEPLATWDDLVLPDTQLATLRQVAVHVRHRLRVYEEWGFARTSARGLGIGVLFSGESGTGKTMAAEVLANDLSLDLYRVDLASTVSKYIGETEKNLRRVFDAAEESGAILLFDEADALFGKRSEVKDSHDRYANIEVSYLLQRMEAYRGLAILTTNAGAALDSAFQRRLRFAIHFPFPDQAMRERIWRGIFPTAAPLGELDYARLAHLNVAGGSIRNIALHAAFLAAHLGTRLDMTHLLQAARIDAAKRERPFSDAEIRGWA